MSNSDGEIKTCPFCGRLYRFASMLCADQSCCPKCRDEREEAANRGEAWEPTPAKGANTNE